MVGLRRSKFETATTPGARRGLALRGRAVDHDCVLGLPICQALYTWRVFSISIPTVDSSSDVENGFARNGACAADSSLASSGAYPDMKTTGSSGRIARNSS